MTRASRNQTANILIFLGFALPQVFIWIFRFMPLQDYPDWVYQAFLFSEILKGHSLSGYSIIQTPVPNALATLVMGSFSVLVPPAVAGKIFLSLYAVLFPLSFIYFFKNLDDDRSRFPILLSFLFVLNTSFFNGNINYVMSLVPLLFGFGYILRARQNPASVSLPVIMLLGILLFFSHAIAYATFLIFLVLWLSLESNGTARMKTAIGMIPSLCLLAGYVYFRLTVSAAGPASVRLFDPLANLRSSAGYFSLFHDFYPFLDAGTPLVKIAGFLNLLFLVCMAALCLRWGYSVLRGITRDRLLDAAVIVFLCAAIFTPLRLGGLNNAAERFTYPAFFLILYRISGQAPLLNARLSRLLAPFLTAAFIVNMTFLFMFVSPVSRQMGVILDALERNDVLAGDFIIVTEDDFNFEGTFTRSCRRPSFLPKHSPLMPLPFYAAVSSRAVMPIFPTGIIAAAVPRDHGPMSMTALAAVNRRPESVVILGSDDGIGKIRGFWGPEYVSVFQDRYAIFLKRSRGRQLL